MGQLHDQLDKIWEDWYGAPVWVDTPSVPATNVYCVLRRLWRLAHSTLLLSVLRGTEIRCALAEVRVSRYQSWLFTVLLYATGLRRPGEAYSFSHLYYSKSDGGGRDGGQFTSLRESPTYLSSLPDSEGFRKWINDKKKRSFVILNYIRHFWMSNCTKCF